MLYGVEVSSGDIVAIGSAAFLVWAGLTGWMVIQLFRLTEVVSSLQARMADLEGDVTTLDTRIRR